MLTRQNPRRGCFFWEPFGPLDNQRKAPSLLTMSKMSQNRAIAGSQLLLGAFLFAVLLGSNAHYFFVSHDVCLLDGELIHGGSGDQHGHDHAHHEPAHSGANPSDSKSEDDHQHCRFAELSFDCDELELASDLVSTICAVERSAESEPACATPQFAIYRLAAKQSPTA